MAAGAGGHAARVLGKHRGVRTPKRRNAPTSKVGAPVRGVFPARQLRGAKHHKYTIPPTSGTGPMGALRTRGV
jgi:hypothetical protein